MGMTALFLVLAAMVGMVLMIDSDDEEPVESDDDELLRPPISL